MTPAPRCSTTEIWASNPEVLELALAGLSPANPGELRVGLARCNEPAELLLETIGALLSGTKPPDRVLVVDNGDDPLPAGTLRQVGGPRICVARAGRNLGCAASWNLILRWSRRARLGIIVNADLAVAGDTLEKIAEVPRPAVVLAYGFGCFRIDPEVTDLVGNFDEAFYPVYFEDVDYRRRLRLASVSPVEWPTQPASFVAPGRERAPTGIVHGKHDPEGYQGWRGDRLAQFEASVNEGRAYYYRKWGGGPAEEVYEVPFDGQP